MPAAPPTKPLIEFAAAWLAAPTEFPSAQLAVWQTMPAMNVEALSAAMPPDAAEALTHATLAQLLARHQFVELAGRDVTALRRIFAGFIGDLINLQASGPAALVARVDLHLAQLTQWRNMQIDPAAPVVVCGEYSAPLQMEVLGFDTWQLTSPLLDIGCGASAHLVRHLRESRWEAYGADRLAPLDVQWDAATPFATWLTYTLPTARFASIVSHMAFSLHFLHNHVRGGATSLRYADAYRHILLALKPGGRFVYAPGLPFIEAQLPPDYDLQTAPLPEPLAQAVAPISRATGVSVDHVSCVTRKRH